MSSAMNEKFQSFLEKSSQIIAREADPSRLRATLARLEQSCVRDLIDDSHRADEKEIKKLLWSSLLRESIRAQNFDLAMLLVAKLHLVQLAMVMQTTIENARLLPNDLSKCMALAYASQYVGMTGEASDADSNYETTRMLLEASTKLKENSLTGVDLNCSADFLLNFDDWDLAGQFIEQWAPTRAHPSLRRVFIKYALHNEIMGNYEQALDSYEQLNAQPLNRMRVMIKLHKRAFWRQLKRAIDGGDADNRDPSPIRQSAIDLMFATGRCETGLEYKIIGQSLDIVRIDKRRRIDLYESSTLEAAPHLPSRLLNFVRNPNIKKWLDEQQIDAIVAMSDSLDARPRALLSELASTLMSNGNHAHAASIYLVCGHKRNAEGLLSKFLSSNDLFSIIARNKNVNASVLLREAKHAKESTRALVYARLGLFDEAIRMLMNSQTDRSTRSCIEKLENICGHMTKLIEPPHESARFERIDPMLEVNTLEALDYMSERGSVTTVIQTVIILATITLIKLDMHAQDNDLTQTCELLRSNLQKIFGFLRAQVSRATSGAHSAIEASDRLVRCIQTLVNTLDDRLHCLATAAEVCDNVREGMKELVAHVCGECMLAGKYRSAALLHASLGDQVQAAKCLMRTGDIEAVIKFALTARDLTVNRLTINFLRHLNADAKLIDSFIAKAQQTDP